MDPEKEEFLIGGDYGYPVVSAINPVLLCDENGDHHEIRALSLWGSDEMQVRGKVSEGEVREVAELREKGEKWVLG